MTFSEIKTYIRQGVPCPPPADTFSILCILTGVFFRINFAMYEKTTTAGGEPIRKRDHTRHRSEPAQAAGVRALCRKITNGDGNIYGSATRKRDTGHARSPATRSRDRIRAFMPARERRPHRAPGAAGDINTHHAQVVHYTPHTRILGVESTPRVMYNRNRNTTPNTAQEEKTNVQRPTWF